jgi:hypothetical protein
VGTCSLNSFRILIQFTLPESKGHTTVITPHRGLTHRERSGHLPEKRAFDGVSLAPIHLLNISLNLTQMKFKTTVPPPARILHLLPAPGAYDISFFLLLRSMYFAPWHIFLPSVPPIFSSTDRQIALVYRRIFNMCITRGVFKGVPRRRSRGIGGNRGERDFYSSSIPPPPFPPLPGSFSG